MSKYCCFFCPEGDYSERKLTDKCPKCGRAFIFPLKNYPERIGDFQIEKALGRGFYASSYIAKGKFGKRSVLKLTPKSFYEFGPFKRTPFEVECQSHVDLAEKADHIVGFQDAFEAEISFKDVENGLPCNVMVLDYVEGPLLKEYVDGNIEADPREICQMTVDLLTIINQLRTNRTNHNDLHSENLIVKKLSASERRVDAISDSIKLMAIDLGSVSGESKSTVNRSGDLTFVTGHIGKLLDNLLRTPRDFDEKDYRIALKLQDLIYTIASSPENLRIEIPDLIKAVRDAYSTAARPFRPWSDSIEVKAFSDHMNAQTLESWKVPSLLVDPEGRWLAKISIAGPQIITGMRGCGKTMLLRALDIHARINKGEKEEHEDVIKRIKDDGYVGLFVSAQKLLDLKQHSIRNIEFRLTRLFVNYSLEATRAILHVQGFDKSLVEFNAHSKMGSAIADYLVGGGFLRDALSLDDLERLLTTILVKTNSGPDTYSVNASPSDFFPHLAEAIRSCSELFNSSMILYLLDDVSTRYHDLDRIGELINVLLFQDPKCAFKFTTEWQTIELGLKSPGREHPIRVGRDIDVFDLGADVHAIIKGGHRHGLRGTKFVASILEKRAKYVESHPKGIFPKDILGTVPLQKIAEEISGSSSTSQKRKNAYRGLSCLSKMCVGDLGDVIKIYDEIVRRYRAGDTLPVAAGLQSECFRDMSSSRLYDLDRRNGYFKSHALAFAEAAHELMVRSYKKAKAKKKDLKHVRMYTSIYVRVTTENEADANQQIDRLREMVDASVFVYTGGSGRSKTKDSNPMRQFILSFRKIYGISNYIGLSDRDRFELSGEDLAQWLEHPEHAKEILIRNQTAEGTSAYIDEDEDNSSQAVAQEVAGKQVQLSLFSPPEPTDTISRQHTEASMLNVRIEKIDISQLGKLPIHTILTSLGFEDRALESNKVLAANLNAKTIYGIKYPLEGYTRDIQRIWNKAGAKVTEIDSDQYYKIGELSKLSLIDISGLTKPFIFKAIHNELVEKGEVIVSYASAKKYYPLQEDLKDLLIKRDGDDFAFLEGLANILVGEEGPYSQVNLLSEGQADPSRCRALIAFAPTKHQRLFSLLDNRDFDWLELVSPCTDSPRDLVANFAADFIAKNQQKVNVGKVDTKNLFSLVDYMGKKYFDLFVDSGFNVEIGLTGSKIEAVASAILAAQRKVSEVWYLKPKKFDSERFSSGFEKIDFFKISTDN